MNIYDELAYMLKRDVSDASKYLQGRESSDAMFFELERAKMLKKTYDLCRRAASSGMFTSDWKRVLLFVASWKLSPTALAEISATSSSEIVGMMIRIDNGGTGLGAD